MDLFKRISEKQKMKEYYKKTKQFPIGLTWSFKCKGIKFERAAQGYILYYFKFCEQDLNPKEEWAFTIRYSDLYRFHKNVEKIIIVNSDEIPQFPKKRGLALLSKDKNDESFYEQRFIQLENYLNLLMKNKNLVNTCIVQDFLKATKYQQQDKDNNILVTYKQQQNILEQIDQKDNEIILQNINQNNEYSKLITESNANNHEAQEKMKKIIEFYKQDQEKTNKAIKFNKVNYKDFVKNKYYDQNSKRQIKICGYICC